MSLGGAEGKPDTMHLRRLLASALTAASLAAFTPAASQAAPPAVSRVTPPTVSRAAPPTAAGTGLVLPAPTGPYPVGVTDLHLVDRHRADPWVAAGRRELMVSLWYPAAGADGRHRPYVTSAESALILQQLEVEGVPTGILSTVRTSARTGAPPLSHRGGLPLVMLSPGFSFPRSSLTALAQDLASRGFVVAGVDHTYEAAAITFPDGRVTTCLVCTMLRDFAVTPGQVTASRAEDLSFVLDQLADHAYAGIRVDPRRVAVAGHSIGGASAAVVMLRDRRFAAGANLDGTFYPPVTTALRRPFLMVEAESHGADPSWNTTWTHLSGWRCRLTVAGLTHGSFTDYAVLGDQVGLPTQTASGTRSAEITRTYVAAFLDRQLRHRYAPLLDGPSAAFPEVTVRR
jgi:predicted dienelactone hydrolase